MAQQRVLNRRQVRFLDSTMVYVGRPSKFGNPYVICRDGNRKEVIEKYRVDVLPRLIDSGALKELKGKQLVCWCAPLPCHADVLVEALEKEE